MPLDLTQPPPHPTTLDEACELVVGLWALHRLEREESERLGEENERLRQENQGLAARVAELEERLGGNSKNSSRPPSSDPPWKKPRTGAGGKSKRRRGGQPGHPGTTRTLVPTEKVDQVVSCPPPERCSCGGRVQADPDKPERRQVFELPEVKPHITEYQVFSGTCMRCHNHVRGTVPDGVPSGVLGPRALALAAWLSGRFQMSKREVAELLREQFGIPVCPATVCAAQQKVGDAVAEAVDEARDFVRTQAVVHADETGMKIAGERAWMWVALSGCVAVFLIRYSRGSVVAKELVGENFSGKLVTDRWSAYTFIAAVCRQLCWAHLTRDFTQIAERKGESAPIGKALLEQTRALFQSWHKFRDGALDRKALEAATAETRAALLALLRQGAAVTDHPKTVATCKNLLELEPALFAFLTTAGVEPTNNDAERELRAFVLWRKKSYGTQGNRGSDFVENILTVLATCRRQGRNALAYLTLAVDHFLHRRPPPSLLPA